MKEWTDTDYAQAAIDMLPDGGPEEIAEFLREQGINKAGRQGDTCPIALWIKRWTGAPTTFVGRVFLYPSGLGRVGGFPTPKHVSDFVGAYDHREIRL